MVFRGWFDDSLKSLHICREAAGILHQAAVGEVSVCSREQR